MTPERASTMRRELAQAVAAKIAAEPMEQVGIASLTENEWIGVARLAWRIVTGSPEDAPPRRKKSSGKSNPGVAYLRTLISKGKRASDGQ